MRFARHWLSLWFLAWVCLPVSAQFGRIVTRAELLPGAVAVRAGEEILIGVKFTLPKNFHIYWRHSGESGQATKITWKLPPGVTVGDPLWPAPEKLLLDLGAGPEIAFVYSHEAILLFPVTVGSGVPMGNLALAAKAEWLECDDKSCVPGSAQLAAEIQVAAATVASGHASTLQAAREKAPALNPPGSVRAFWTGNAVDQVRPLVIEWVGGPPRADFYPYLAEGVRFGPRTEVQKTPDGRVRIALKVETEGAVWPTQVTGLLAIDGGGGSFEITRGIAADEQATPPGVMTNAPVARALAGTGGEARPAPLGMLMALVFAFVGGLILNIMPCVLPVISLKILGFVRQAKESPAQVRKLGLMYALGVLVSFLVFAGVVVGIKAAGESASWGMQFQNPYFLVGLMTLVVLVTLNLFSVFEVTAGSGGMGTAGQLSRREGSVGAFFNGVLAVVLATPCTAPFLAPALGFAFAQPALIVFLIFVTIAAGLAAPYVVLTWNPALLRFLPKPGDWMIQFKHFMAFPMMATSVWLYTLAAEHYADVGYFWLGIWIVVVCLAAWVYGQFVQGRSERRAIPGMVVAALLAIGYFWILESEVRWRQPRQRTESGSDLIVHGGITGRRWSAETVAKIQAEGRPILVDFTAEWCPNCKANWRRAIDTESVRAVLKRLNVQVLIADYTHRDERITEELKKWDRAGVPMVLVYPGRAGAEAALLPDWLTQDLVIAALERAAK